MYIRLNNETQLIRLSNTLYNKQDVLFMCKTVHVTVQHTAGHNFVDSDTHGRAETSWSTIREDGEW